MFQWISCKERLPEPDVFVLVCYNEPVVWREGIEQQLCVMRLEAYTDDNGDTEYTWIYWDGDDIGFEDVSHWMPLPEIPEEMKR